MNLVGLVEELKRQKIKVNLVLAFTREKILIVSPSEIFLSIKGSIKL
jgi:hypothetical protein